MKVSKKVIGNLEKCYSVAPLTYKGKKHMLVAAEKVNQCRLYDLEGNQEEVIWEEDLETYQPLNKFWGTYSAVKYRFMTQVIGVPVTRVCYGAVIPSAPGELTYSEAVYWQNRCRQELEVYNNDPANPDRPLSGEYGPISF